MSKEIPYYAGVDWELYDDHAVAYMGDREIALVKGRGGWLKARVLIKNLLLRPKYGKLTNKVAVKTVTEEYTTQHNYQQKAAQALERNIDKKYGKSNVKGYVRRYDLTPSGMVKVTVTASVVTPLKQLP